jgi:hypothetical protein
MVTPGAALLKLSASTRTQDAAVVGVAVGVWVLVAVDVAVGVSVAVAVAVGVSVGAMGVLVGVAVAVGVSVVVGVFVGVGDGVSVGVCVAVPPHGSALPVASATTCPFTTSRIVSLFGSTVVLKSNTSWASIVKVANCVGELSSCHVTVISFGFGLVIRQLRVVAGSTVQRETN